MIPRCPQEERTHALEEIQRLRSKRDKLAADMASHASCDPRTIREKQAQTKVRHERIIRLYPGFFQGCSFDVERVRLPTRPPTAGRTTCSTSSRGAPRSLWLNPRCLTSSLASPKILTTCKLARMPRTTSQGNSSDRFPSHSYTFSAEGLLLLILRKHSKEGCKWARLRACSAQRSDVPHSTRPSTGCRPGPFTTKAFTGEADLGQGCLRLPRKTALGPPPSPWS